ncbi:leucyl/phenylalanyl-tRNA--protein transferase [Bordetella tumulicola]|uniref:leucyl/phenylalanyl-tRNA--protein transferase n=1 Tax=Bordetella tumulicola TaxID=1649133 RepID=UPI0039EFEE5D
MKLAWLEPDTPFPPVEDALSEPAGLLALGADLSLARLRLAYANGIFPWYSCGEPILWWSPDPRMVLACRDFAVSRSLGKRLRQIARDESSPTPRIQVRVDTAFETVMGYCAAPRDGQAGTWITGEMQQAYLAWHLAGDAHSVETWIDGALVGGLYGISLGGMFFGESMFMRAPDASKIALAYLVTFLRRFGVQWIDCQQQTRHLASLGAGPVTRAEFVEHVRQAVTRPTPDWRTGWLDSRGSLHDLIEQH